MTHEFLEMSYTELEHGYQGLRKTRSAFYVGDEVNSRIAQDDISELCDDDDSSSGEEGKQVVVGVCAMAKKSQSKQMKEILTRLQEFEYIKMIVFAEEVILTKPVDEWPICDCLVSFHSKGFPLDKAIQYAALRNPFIINNLLMQYDIQDRRKVYSILESEGIEIPRYAVLHRDFSNPTNHELIESEDHVEVNSIVFNKPFVEKPVSAEDHNVYIYYPTSAGGGSQRLFRKIGSRSSVYSAGSRVRKIGSFIYEDFMPTDGTDVKVYTVGPDYAHAEARKSPALDGKVERDSDGKEVRYPVILSNAEKLISRKVCLAFKQTVCGFDLLRANGKSFVCDVNGFSFVKNSNKYYDDCAKILGNMILRELAPTLHIPWSVPFQLDDPPIVPTTFGKMMELRCVVAVIRHGDRTPKQKMKVEVRHPKFFEIFEKYGGISNGHVKLKRPKQLQEILDIARSLLNEIEHQTADTGIEEKQGKLEQLKSVLEMYGHFSGINRKVQMKYQPKGRPRGSSSDDVCSDVDKPKEPSLVLILKWGGELTPAGRIQAEEMGKIFRCMYPGGQGRHAGGEYAGKQGLGLLRLHSTFRHDLKIYASDEGRVQMTAAAFAKGLLALEGELTPILVQMVKSANTNGLLDNDCDASKYQNIAKAQLHELMQQDHDFTLEDIAAINPCNAISISKAVDFVKNPVKCCKRVQELIQKLMNVVRTKRNDPKTRDAALYHGETWELMGRRWSKIEKDFCTKNKLFDISKVPDIYDCIKYDLQHNQHTLQFDLAEELYINAKYLADIVIPQEYGLTMQEKLTISQGICTPLLKKIRADLQRNIEESGDETVNRLNPRYSHGVSSPGRHVRTRLYFTSESHVHSLLTVLRFGGLIDYIKDEQWRRAMEYISMVTELNYMSQIVVMLYEDPTKDPFSEERFHVELHFSPGVNCCVQKNLPPGPGFRPHSRNETSAQAVSNQEQSQQLSNTEQEDTGSEDSSVNCSVLKSLPLGPGFRSHSLNETQAVTKQEQSQQLSNIEQEDNNPEERDVNCYVQKNLPLGSGFPPHSRNETSAKDVTKQNDTRPEDSGVNVCFQKTLPPGPGFCPHIRNEIPAQDATNQEQSRQLASIKQEDTEPEDSTTSHNSACLKETSVVNVETSPPTQQKNEDDSIFCKPSKASQPMSVSIARFNPSNKLSDAILQTEIKKAQCCLSLLKQVRPLHDEPRARNFDLSRDHSSHHKTNTSEPGPSRRHRHSISGQMSYLRMTGYGSMTQYQRRGVGGNTNSLFSTAVISGSSSAPNLRDMIPNTAAVTTAVAIRPLETLHNALSLRQLDVFLDKMTHTTQPKTCSTPIAQSVQSPNNSMGWSGPPSFVSSGPSSPNGITDFIRGAIRNSDNSDFSPNNNGFSIVATGNNIFRDDGGDINIDDYYSGHRDSLEIVELLNWSQQQQINDNSDNMHFSPIKPAGENLGDIGNVTPVSITSKIDRNEFGNITYVEDDDDDDEDKTLTSFTTVDINRPSLAEIKWSRDDNDAPSQPNSTADEPKEIQKFAFGRFECVGADLDLHNQITKKNNGLKGSCSNYACEENFEINTKGDQIPAATSVDQHNISHVSEPLCSVLNEPNSSENSDPV